jgi:hypothetical protein
VGSLDRRARRCRIDRNDSLAIVEVAEEERWRSGVKANDPSADIGEKTAANRRGQPTADLRHLKPSQY